jgi:phospholipid/cholesterol/gamma-HCH transport system permease protein
MESPALASANLAEPSPQQFVLSGNWTARCVGKAARQVDALQPAAGVEAVASADQVGALDTAGAWVLQKLLLRLRSAGGSVQLNGLRPDHARLLDAIDQQFAEQASRSALTKTAEPSRLERIGRSTWPIVEESIALLAFVGETAMAFVHSIMRPQSIRWRPILYNIRRAGFDALPIVGLLAFLLGVVVAYQGADQLRLYGANIFVADLVGISMLREFAPLITAIIVAGRSGSAYAAQIGTMKVTEEIDAMRTLGISPQEMLVLPKVIALVIALPLLTVFADILGVTGGMLMASAQLDVGYGEFLDRFIKAIVMTTFTVGIGKAPVFALIIVIVGCFQGFRTRGGAESVGRQTTRSVVQAIFLVIVADSLFSIVFSALGL